MLLKKCSIDEYYDSDKWECRVNTTNQLLYKPITYSQFVTTNEYTMDDYGFEDNNLIVYLKIKEYNCSSRLESDFNALVSDIKPYIDDYVFEKLLNNGESELENIYND